MTFYNNTLYGVLLFWDGVFPRLLYIQRKGPIIYFKYPLYTERITFRLSKGSQFLKFQVIMIFLLNILGLRRITECCCSCALRSTLSTH